MSQISLSSPVRLRHWNPLGGFPTTKAAVLAATLTVAGVSAGCGRGSAESPAAGVGSDSSAIARSDSALPPAERVKTVAEWLPAPAADTTPAPADSAARAAAVGHDTTSHLGARAPAAAAPAKPAAAPAAVKKEIRWPTGPTPLAGSLLPNTRIVAYYGNPLSKRMGILGQIPPKEMLERLEHTAELWQKADTNVRVQPALHLIATVAQGRPGPERKYRLRMTDSLIEQVAGWAESKGFLLFLDIQTGHSTIQEELPRILPYLKRPYVHLALDPEFAMLSRGDSALPGKKIGIMTAEEINYAIDEVSKVVAENGLPPKILVVHRFTGPMIRGASRIKLDPRVQVVIDMDGFGAPSLKRATWKAVITRDPVQFTGIKLFYKNDKPLMAPTQVLESFHPAPVYVQYQ